jgi:hypothetical protein
MTTPNETKTFIIQDRNDANMAFALADHIQSLGLLDPYLAHKVSNLAECVAAQRFRPDDEGAHPYDGAAEDTFWELAEEFEDLPGVEIDYITSSVTFPASA